VNDTRKAAIGRRSDPGVQLRNKRSYGFATQLRTPLTLRDDPSQWLAPLVRPRVPVAWFG